jgi:hypothetical protein
MYANIRISLVTKFKIRQNLCGILCKNREKYHDKMLGLCKIARVVENLKLQEPKDDDILNFKLLVNNKPRREL